MIFLVLRCATIKISPLLTEIFSTHYSMQGIRFLQSLCEIYNIYQNVRLRTQSGPVIMQISAFKTECYKVLKQPDIFQVVEK